MKKEPRRNLSRTGEYAVIAALLSVYGLAIVLCPDPEWVVWAGQMTVGVIDPAAMPPAIPAAAAESLRTASTLGALGALVAVGLAVAGLAAPPGWLTRLAGHGVTGRGPGGQGTGGQA